MNASDYDLTLQEPSEASVGRLLAAQVFDFNFELVEQVLQPPPGMDRLP